MSLQPAPQHKIKVLRIIARLIIGGPSFHVINLNRGLNPHKFESLLVCGTENAGEQSLMDFAFSQGIKPVVISEMVAEASLKPCDVKALYKLYWMIRRERPDIVHTHTAKAGFLGRLAARLAKVPVIIHTYHGHILHGYYGPLKTNLLRRMEKTLAHITDCIIAVSAEVKRELVTYGVSSSERIVVIPLGLELEPFLNCAARRGELRRELGIDDGAPLVGIVGRIVPIKNHRLFLDASLMAANQNPQVRFVIVGDGPIRAEMQRYAYELGMADRVIFVGWRRDLQRIYADLDVLVLSSINEGTPVSAIEAMAAGCPVAATRVGGLPDLITEGETGLLVPSEDAKALATAIDSLLKNPRARRQMGQIARGIVKERFAAQRLISDMERLYQELLGKAQR
jgi:glycosyltransferase involved in cell wall biosynthesis